MIFTVAIGKGGAGKTATAAELCALLPGRVLAIDLDRQHNLSTRLGVTDVNSLPAVAADVLTGDAPLDRAATQSPELSHVEVIAGSEDLNAVETSPEILMSLRAQLTEPDVQSRWDHVVIDTPSHQGLITLAGIAAADQVVTPIACSGEAYLELARLSDFIATKLVKPRLRPGLGIDWVVPVMYRTRGAIDADVLATLGARYGEHLTPPVREAAAVRAAFVAGQPVSIYAPRHGVTQDYKAAISTIVNGALE